ncbi:MAG: NitT/TauT family transport system substrate-binding protein [Pseudonocardiales bacterium]|jgi:NitT/TauT family transport system substrate-binding protein|nr:NitT/TauT family transport system substrate-binding protein [Pseudonocardiales bacterium]
MIRRSITLAGLLALTLVVAACGSAAPAQNADGSTPIDVGTSSTLSNASLYYADSGGAFARHKLAAKLTVVQSGAAAIPLLLNGQLQFVAADPVSAIVAVSKNIPVTIVAAGSVTSDAAATDSSSILVRADSPIASVRDLAGRTVAVNALKSLAHITVMSSIDKSGGDSSAVKFVELPLPQMVDAVSRGQVDAAAENEPFSTQGVRNGLRKIAAPLSEAVPGSPQVIYLAEKRYAAEHQPTVRAFAEAVAEAGGYLGQHPDQVRAVGRTSTATPPDILGKIVLPVFSGDQPSRASLTGVMDLVVRYRVIPAPVDLGAMITQQGP